MTSADDAPFEWDFFISYTQADMTWAEWIAWTLEEDGHRVLIQAWDFVPGSNWIEGMQQGVQKAARTIAVLSAKYAKSVYGSAEWEAAWAQDPAGTDRKLLVVRVEDCNRPGLLRGVVDFDLFGLTETDAKARLRQKIAAAVAGRSKPDKPPQFPGKSRAVRSEPEFPGKVGTPSARDRAGAIEDGSGPVLTGPVPDMPLSVASDGWDEFEPGLLHYVVVGSESLAGSGPASSLSAVVEETLSSPEARRLWGSFREAWNGRELLRSGPRQIPEDYDGANVRMASFNVSDAFFTDAGLDRAVRLIVQSDLALFDATRFEPGVMLLLGIRAATRRGVTIISHGDWVEGTPLIRPFNLSDLSLASHAPPRVAFAGDDPRIKRLVDRVRTGFDQLRSQPHYLDLPVYDALRQLGPQETARRSIPLKEQVLMLCSYGEDYFPTWQWLRQKLKIALSKKHAPTDDVTRFQDMATPQLVSQSLYERIRRCAACVADWSHNSPSTFFELGVRLAVSQWGVVQILDENWLRGKAKGAGPEEYYNKQFENMRALLDPLLYKSLSDDDIGFHVAAQLIEFRDAVRGDRGHRLQRVAAEALGPVQETLPYLPTQLMDEADALNHVGRDRDNVPQALFFEIPEIGRDHEKAARERRLAAWLYLDHRAGAAGLGDDDPQKHRWRELGKIVAAELYDSGDDADLELADKILSRVT